MAGNDPANPETVRLRVLVTAAHDNDPAWLFWQRARGCDERWGRIAVQRVSAGSSRAPHPSVGIGLKESLRWFHPAADDLTRGRICDLALRAADLGELPALEPDLHALAWSASDATAPLADITLLSHAETDLLALQRAVAELPAGFPTVAGRSLNGLPAALLGNFGALAPARKRVLIVRIHGEADGIPGLDVLLQKSAERDLTVIVISGTGGDSPLPASTQVPAAWAATLTRYFMAGGVRNVAHAMRYVGRECLGISVDVEPCAQMPAHGLYHPDLLVTSPAEWQSHDSSTRPTAVVLFYRAHVLSGNLDFVDRLVRALESRGLSAIGVFTSSLRERDASGMPCALALLPAPVVIVNTVSFPMLTLSSWESAAASDGHACFERLGAPVIQGIACGTSREQWEGSARGLNPAETAMNIALPECDGRVIAAPVSFKERHRYVPDEERIGRVANLAARFSVLRTKPAHLKRIAVVLGNAGGKAQRVGGAVGLDTPASLLKFLLDLRKAGYHVADLPGCPEELLSMLMQRGCYDEKCPLDANAAWRMPRAHYTRWFAARSDRYRQHVRAAWGEPGSQGPTLAAPFWRAGLRSEQTPLLSLTEPHTSSADYLFAALEFGNVLVAIQPPRGFGFDPETMYHSSELPPCHHYAAFYRWIADEWRADAMVHFGTHGTLEWLPGKSVALSADCAPDALLGDLPLFYPFVINNPGEGAQAKRRAHAVLIGHLIPPLTQAETYGPLAALMRLVEEYYRAESLDPDKLPVLRTQIWELVRAQHLEEDLAQIRRQRHGDHEHTWDTRLTERGVPRSLEEMSGRGFAHLLEDLDAYLCELGRAQIRDGLHIFGCSPRDGALIDLMCAILFSANGEVPALPDAVARACAIAPVDLDERRGVWPDALSPALGFGGAEPVSSGQVRGAIDRLGRELLGELAATGFDSRQIGALLARYFARDAADPERVGELAATLTFACEVLAPALERTSQETTHLLAGLAGRFVPPGPSGAPSRGMAHVLPTGRNFYTVDPRALPTPAAWKVGSAQAQAALQMHRDETGRWPQTVALSVWGTPTMRTGGDEIAHALALLGVRPLWEPVTRRPTGLEVLSVSELGRPRIDVTLRVSGFFRDAFPMLMQWVDEAVRRVVLLDESDEQNYPRKHWRAETKALTDQGLSPQEAAERAALRLFSTRPGTYGTGLQETIDGGTWTDAAGLAEIAIRRGGWAYGARAEDGVEAVELYRQRLSTVELAVHGFDHREQDLFDSSDFFEFHGGLIAAATAASGRPPAALVCDSSAPSGTARVRTLQAEALRVFRSRVINPRWLESVRRHGYRGGQELGASIDSLFGFAATAGIVTDWMFEQAAAHLAGGASREFLARANPWALHAIAERLLEAASRGLWAAAPQTLEDLRTVLLDSEAAIEDHADSVV